MSGVRDKLDHSIQERDLCGVQMQIGQPCFCVVVGTESYVCDQLPKLPEEPPPIGDCAAPGALAAHPQGDVTGMENKGLRGRRTWRQMAVTPMKASTTTRGGLEPTAALPGQVRHAPSAVRLHEHRVLGRLSQPPAHIRGSLSHK